MMCSDIDQSEIATLEGKALQTIIAFLFFNEKCLKFSLYNLLLSNEH